MIRPAPPGRNKSLDAAVQIIVQRIGEIERDLPVPPDA